MIISHRHKFIFIKTVKTAGTSIEIALSEICGPEDVITPISKKDEAVRKELGIPGPQNINVPFRKYQADDWIYLITKFRRVKYYNHVPAYKIKQWIAPEIWNTYYKFCFERNPYDKVVSHYFWKGGDRKFKTISRYLSSRIRKKIEAWRQYKINNEIVVDKIYPFEELDLSLKDISARLGLSSTLNMPTVKTKSSTRKDKRHWSEILSGSEKKWITEHFRETFQLMDYTKL